MRTLFVAGLCLLAPLSATAARLFNSTTEVVGVPGFPRNALFADLDRNGVADLVVPLADNLGLGVAKAVGPGLYGPFSVRFTGRGDLMVKVGDVDGDGLLDAAGIHHYFFGPAESTGVFIAYGDGNGGWADSFEVKVPNLGEFGLVDLDQDGRSDVVAGVDDSMLTVFHANANRTMTRIGTYAAAAKIYSFNGLVADLVGSSALDYVVGTETGVSVYEGNGDGTLGARTDNAFPGTWNYLALAEVDAVPGLDLVLTGLGAAVASGSGGGTFALPVSLPGEGLNQGLVVRDLDGDGQLDIATTDRLQGSRGLVRWESNGAGGVGPRVVDGAAGSIPSSLEEGDANGDLRPDLLYCGAFTRNAYIALANPDGSFGEPQSVPQIAGRLTGLAVGDFDEDGHLDAFGSDTFAAKVAFAHGHGDGSFDPLVTTATPLLYNRLIAGRFDGDAHLDVFALQFGSSSTAAAVFKGHGDGTFDAPVPLPLPAPGGTIPVAADVDNDGDLDVAVPCPTANAIAVFKQGPAGLAAPVSSPSLTGAAFVRYADLNGDNRTDRIVSGTGQWAVELEVGSPGTELEFAL